MKKHFITGLIILLPLVMTIAIVVFLVNLLTEPFTDIVSALLDQIGVKGFLFFTHQQVLKYGSKILILLILFLFTVSLGMLARLFLIDPLLRLGDSILHRIPLINTIYKTTKDIIQTLFVSDSKAFKQVVMVPFPRQGVYVLGLIASDAPTICNQTLSEDLVSVFIPTTLNPTTGFLLMFKRSDLTPVAISPEDALKYIISCGVILPETQGGQSS
jgi:uncharacterized membrane protein